MLEEGQFYPLRSMSAEERLWWYSQHFDTVEVNSTFYAPLSAQNAVLWVKRTPPGFLFNVKAYALLTGHHVDAGRLPEPLREMLPASARPNARGQFDNKLFPEEARAWVFESFREALRPLRGAGKLGYVLFQLAPWVRYARETLEYLEGLPEKLPGVTLAVEFRDRSWLPGHTGEALDLLARRAIAYVSVDAPRLSATVAPVLALTSPVAVLRLHGRNVEGHLKQLRGQEPSVAEKYDYLYSEAEVEEIVESARRLGGHAEIVFVKFNNNRADYPAINGIQARARLLGWTPPDREELVLALKRRRRSPASRFPGPANRSLFGEPST
ncbi:MAG: DUF72 domain-containing protein [Candidatus Rokubacteria bacterium]|nr:DUF72 domain-containing protein [Candidatus Rokubacteria bacterium]